ncbi:MAG TPA: fibronectin type III domain-containing protein [Terriglobia bacterium]|nr:fibronectin type III domain-containing protein [Terriglobia bacterium]
MMPISLLVLLLLQFTDVGAQNGWRMEGFNSSRTNVSPLTGPTSLPTFRVIAANVTGNLKRTANDGSLILTDGTTVSSYTDSGQMRWQRNILAGLNGPVVDLAVGSSGVVYASSAHALIALDPTTGQPGWVAPFVANTGDESAPLVVGKDGTIYFHTGGTSPGFQERFTAINPDGTRKWEYLGNTGRGYRPAVFSTDQSTVYLYQLDGSGGLGRAIGLSSVSGKAEFKSACDVKAGIYAFSDVLNTGGTNSNLLKFPADIQNCAVSASGLLVTDTAAALNAEWLVVKTPLPGTDSSYAAIDSQGRTLWSRNEPLVGGFADTPANEGRGTFFAVAPKTNELVAIRIATGDDLWRQRFPARISGVTLGGDKSVYLVSGTDLFRSDSQMSSSRISLGSRAIAAPSSSPRSSRLASVAADASGLVAAFGFSEGSGPTTADTSASGFNGTLANGTLWTTGKNGTGLSFDGLDDKVALPATLDIAALPFTLEAWIKPTGFADWRAFFSKRDGWASTLIRFDVGLAISTGNVYVTTYNSTVTFAYVPPLNAWTHLTVVATSSGTALYANGVLQETLSAVTLGTGATAAVAIGGSADDDDHFAGTIDDLRVYSRALSQTEIQADMNTPVSTGGPLLQITQPLPGASIAGTTVNVTYTASGDLTAVNHVHFTLDSNPEVMDMSFDGVYQFTNVATGNHVLNGYLVRVDHSKILGTDATPVSFSTSVPDTTPPTATVTNPLAGATVSGSISVIATASDNVGIAGVQFLLDGQPLGSEDTSAPYSTTWNTTSSTNGGHAVAARARDLAGNLATSTSVSVTVSNSSPNDPTIVGQWSAPTTWPLVSVHLNVLPTGKVLAWDNSIDHANHLNAAVVWDPITNAFTDVTNPAVNIFCAGQTQLADGKIIVVGGHIDNDIGINAVTVFDPFTLTWTSKTPMSSARWYPGATTLGDGRVLALVGTTNCKDCIASTPEVYNPATDSWQTLAGATSAFARYYPHSFVLPDGRVLVTGTPQIANASQFSIPSRILNVNTQTWTTVDPATNAEGLSVMYQPGKVVRIGGSWDDGFGYPLTGTAVLDMSAPTPAWRSTAPMQFARVLHNLTILPDGSVLSTGGANDAALNPPANKILYTAELWSPDTETWTTLSDMSTPRLYHSTTALLPDGRVLVAGGGRAFTTDQFNAEIYSPPYLFKGARPTITSAPGRAGYGGTMFVATPNAAQTVKVSLVRPTSVTHTTNFSQQFIPLTFQTVPGGLNVTIPANGNVAPPGYYMLFLVNANGVPSVASFVRLETDTAPPVISAVASSSITSSGATVTWTTNEQADSQVEYGTTVSYGQSSTLDAALVTAHSVTLSGLSAGTTYHFRAKSRDGVGNLATGGDNTFTTSGAGDTAPPTAPSGLTATVAGGTQINLAWTASTDNVGVTGYRVERCQGAGCSNFAQIATPAGITYNDPGLTPATSYSYRVRANDAVGNLSGYSNAVTATTNSAPSGGPVAAYSFDAGTGTSLADLSGNANTGTITSGTWTTSGKYGNALVFNGSSSRVNINDSASLHLTTGLTLEAWVFPTAAPSGWRDLIYKQNDIYMLEASSSLGVGPTVSGTFGNGFQGLAGGSVLPVNMWTHVAATFDGAKLAMWVNGVQVASKVQASPLTVSTLPLQIGGDSLYGQNFAGRIDEVRVYNRALTQLEIEVDMNTPVGPVTDTTAPTIPGSVRSFAGGTPPSVIGRQAYINSTSLTSHTSAAFDSTGGDLIFLFASSHANVTLTPTDNKGNTWISAAGPTNHTPGVDLRSQIWYAKTPNVGIGHTVTMTLSAAQPLVISALVIKGSNTTAPLDVISSITDDGGVATTSIGSATINTTKPADLLVDFAKTLLGATWTAGTGYTFESLASSNYLVAEDSIAGAAGSYTAGWTLTPATNWQNVLLGVVSANASASNSQITTTWSPSTDNTGVTGYLVERCTGSACSNFAQVGSTTGFTTVSYTDTGLTAGTAYRYRVRSKDAAGNLGAYSSAVTATTTGSTDGTAPTAPAGLTAAAASTSQLNLTWTASTDNVGVTGYMIERCQGAGCSSFAQVATNTTTSHSDTGLLEGAGYSYRVRATDAAANLSGYSNVASSVTDTRPTAPSTLTAAAASGTQINVSWTASTSSLGISNYQVERCQGAACSNFVQIATSAATTYSDTGLSAATTYSYRVRASDTHNNLSVYSNTAGATTTDTVPPSAPSNLTATQSSTTQINLTWTASTDNVAVTGYRVERCQGAGCTSFAQIASPTAANFSDTGLTANASYSYRVRATDAAGNLSGYSNTATATTTDTVPPSAPSNLTATTAGGTEIDLSWTASTDNVGVTGYQLERCLGVSCTSFAQIASPTATTYNDTGVTAGVPYSYRVRATDAAGNLSGYSNTVTAATADTVSPSAPSSLTATAAGGTQINLSWTASTDNVGITGYLVERCQSAGCTSFAQIASPTATTYSDTSLTSATSYSYRVRATDAAGNLSGYSNTATATTTDTVAPSAPSNVTATAAGGTQINLSWTASTDNVGVTGYLLERCLGASCTSFAQIASPTTTTYSDTGLTSGTSYSYRVRATDGAGNLSGYSNTASATTADTVSPSAPSSLTATAAGGTQINLSWAASTDNVGVTGYQLERCQGVSCTAFAQIVSPTAVTYSDTGLTAGASYSYRVRATDAAGNLSGYSNVASATTPAPDISAPTAPSNLAATTAGGTQINLTWTASTDNVGVIGYRVERCLGSGCSSFTQIATPAGVSYSDTGLTAGSSYSYRVRATDAAGNLSAYSNVASATTAASNGLVAAYSFNEGTGTTVADSSGNGNAGTISNATWSTSGKYSNTLVFNGTNSLVTINDSASLHLSTGMTLEAWVFPTATPSGWVDLIYKQNDAYLLEASSTWGGQGPTGGGTFDNGFQAVPGPSPISVNAWTHLAVTFDGANITLWINGVNVASQAQTSPLTSSTLPLQIGGDSIYGQFFTGRIDEVRIYNRALAKNEIEVDMNTPVGSVADTTAPAVPSNATAFAGGTPASIIARQSYVNATNKAANTTATFDSTGGDLIVVFASSHENVPTMTLTDNKANTWITAAGPTNHSSSSVDMRSQIWYAKAAKAGTGHTVTLTLSPASSLVMSVLVIKGSNTTSPIDVTSNITDDGGIATTSITGSAITTTRPADLLLDFAKSAVSVVWTAASGYTFESTASSNYVGTEDAIAAAPGSYAASWTMTPANNWHNVLTSVVSANASFSSTQITMTWSPSTDNIGVTGYVIERCQGAGCSTFTQVGSTSGFSTTYYTDTALSAATTYLYRIRARDAVGNLSAYSSTATATTTP